MRCLARLFFLTGFALLAACTTREAERDSVSAPSQPRVQLVQPIALAPTRIAPVYGTAVARGYSELVIDQRTGRVLHEQNADGRRYPASLTKMMTLYILFEDIRAGRMRQTDLMTVSANAAAKPATKLGLQEGETITVLDAIRAMSIKSANDVATVVAEHVSGTEEAFADRMTRTAQSLGMSSTRFVNASGLPQAGQVTTARDMAKLARAIKTRHARYTPIFSARSYYFRGRRYDATNKLLGRVQGVDGLKTGYIRLAGHNLAATARRNGKAIIVVVLGGKSRTARDETVTVLVNRHLQ